MATLTLIFTTNNNPTNGYIVKYRQTGTTQYTTVTPNPTGSPVLITGLGAGLSYEGTIQADCGNGQYGTVSTFNAVVPAQFNMARDPSSASNACGLTNYNYTFYAAVATLIVGTQLYADSNLTVAYSTSGYYSDGQKIYQVSSAGVVLAITYCCKTYTNTSGSNWVGVYQSCNGTWLSNQTVTPGNNICAVNGTPLTTSGSNLTVSTVCGNT